MRVAPCASVSVSPEWRGKSPRALPQDTSSGATGGCAWTDASCAPVQAGAVRRGVSAAGAVGPAETGGPDQAADHQCQRHGQGHSRRPDRTGRRAGTQRIRRTSLAEPGTGSRRDRGRGSRRRHRRGRSRGIGRDIRRHAPSSKHPAPFPPAGALRPAEPEAAGAVVDAAGAVARRCWGGRRRRWRQGNGRRVKATGAGSVGRRHSPRSPPPPGRSRCGGGGRRRGGSRGNRGHDPPAISLGGNRARNHGRGRRWARRMGHHENRHTPRTQHPLRLVDVRVPDRRQLRHRPPVEAAAGLESREEVLLNALPLPGAHAFWPAANRETDTASALDTLRAAIAHAAENCPMLRDQSSFIRATSMAASITAGIDRNGSSHDVANGTA